jgi:hypothetical protein
VQGNTFAGLAQLFQRRRLSFMMRERAFPEAGRAPHPLRIHGYRDRRRGRSKIKMSHYRQFLSCCEDR